VATKTVTTYSCDKCGRESEEVRTYTLPVGTQTYAVDLCPKDAKPFVTATAVVQEFGHRLAGNGTRFRTTVLESDPRAIRVWAASHGIEVPARGRLSKTVVEQYRSARG
jgi:hypothetical protein